MSADFSGFHMCMLSILRNVEMIIHPNIYFPSIDDIIFMKE